MGKFYATDWLTIALLRKLGGATHISMPPSLSVDDRASVLNRCKIPGVKTVVSGNEISLTLVPEEQTTFLDWDDEQGLPQRRANWTALKKATDRLDEIFASKSRTKAIREERLTLLQSLPTYRNSLEQCNGGGCSGGRVRVSQRQEPQVCSACEGTGCKKPR